MRYTYAGELFGKLATVAHVRTDGVLILHFDDDGPNTIRCICSSKVAPDAPDAPAPATRP